MSLGIYILTIVILAVLCVLLNYLKRIFFNQGEIEIVPMEDREIWRVRFDIPEEKIKSKKYVVLRVDTKKEKSDDI